MAKKMYVGSLSYGANEDELRRIFEEHGTVVSAQVIMDRETGRSKGFAFVEMSDPSGTFEVVLFSEILREARVLRRLKGSKQAWSSCCA